MSKGGFDDCCREIHSRFPPATRENSSPTGPSRRSSLSKKAQIPQIPQTPAIKRGLTRSRRLRHSSLAGEASVDVESPSGSAALVWAWWDARSGRCSLLGNFEHVEICLHQCLPSIYPAHQIRRLRFPLSKQRRSFQKWLEPASTSRGISIRVCNWGSEDGRWLLEEDTN
jgi:hypothetical protein